MMTFVPFMISVAPVLRLTNLPSSITTLRGTQEWATSHISSNSCNSSDADAALRSVIVWTPFATGPPHAPGRDPACS